MMMKPLTIAAGLLAAPAVNAFLIPPEVSAADIEIANNVATKISEIQPIELECPGCPLLIKDRSGFDVQLQTDKTSHLELVFSIDHHSEGDRLVVNGFELYPNADPFSNQLVAPQVLDTESETDRHDDGHEDGGHHKHPHHRRPKPQPQRLGFGMHVGPVMKSPDSELELIEVELQIIEIGFSFVENIPRLKVNLLKDSTGKLLMSPVEKATPQKSVEAPVEGEEECATAMCKIMAITRQKMKDLKKMRPTFGCHGGKMRPAHHGEHPHHPQPVPHGIRPPHLQFSQREHSWGKLFKNIFAHILLPVLIGIVAGVSVSLIGMAVGTAIVSTWRFFFRKPSHRHHRRHSRSHSRKISRSEAVVAEEKSGLMEQQQEEEQEDAPPAYVDEVTKDDKPAEV
ncbi:hypothetical protein QBC35DRAFT_484335 [Podospora australis]|uniref:DUF7728 domain-containing protein n=1 Tax=Podospora australis TaxID=1536484 RepID=A0AAN6X3H5_9PEZI|nr:hypothetical protein QBC35DRAFT_484335 [Podospora australis]